VGAVLLATLAVALGAAQEAAAHCNAALLCPGTGACAINVSTGPNTKIDNGCVLNFDGRDVTVNGTLDIDGNAVTIRARNFTLAPGGLIDGSPEGGFIQILATGGNILVQSSAQRGINLVGQDQGGTVLLDATGNVTIEGGRLKVNNGGSRPTEASGGTISLRAGGNLRISGTSDVDARGGMLADGGSIDFLAVGRLDLEADVSVAGGEGGDVTIEAGGEIVLNGAVTDHSVGGGGSGGFVEIASELSVTVGGAIRSRGSQSIIDMFGGDGGFVAIASEAGDVIVRDEISVQSGEPDGGGGEIEIFAGGSLRVEGGSLVSRGEGIDSFGNSVIIDSDHDVIIDGLIDVSGGSEGGSIEIAAGRNVEIANTLDVRARQPSFSGTVLVDAGLLTGGGVTLKAGATQAQAGRILANGVQCVAGFCSVAGAVDISGCDVTVEGKPTAGSPVTPGAVDASAPGASGVGGSIAVAARRRLTLGIGATIDAGGAAGSQGTVALIFPSSQPLFTGQAITPTPTQTRCGAADCSANPCHTICGNLCDCGNGTIDFLEQCDTGIQGCQTGAVCGVAGTTRECACINTCGNGTVDAGEQCDGTDSGTTCDALGFADADAVPCTRCAFDTSVCDVGRCGDGIRAPRNDEVCDGADVGTETCVTRGFTRGTLACRNDCAGFDTSGCVVGRCGDGILDAGEQCDLGAGNSNAPDAACRTNCHTPRCGDGITDPLRNEQCDDGNQSNGDPCRNGCVRATCGDGFVCSNLSCTTGPNGGPEQCDAVAVCCVSCGRRICPDGILCSLTDTNGCCHPNTTCNDGDPCTTDSCNLTTGCAHAPVPNCCTMLGDSRCNDNNPCTNDQCNVGARRCEHVPNTATCNDSNACTQGDVCAGGTCDGATVTCVPPDACREVVGCNPASGCQFRFISGCCIGEGGACDDGNACTQGDTCSGGTCAGTAVQCTALDQCHDAGVCNPATGQCSNPPKADGTTCADGNACTQVDTCQAGTCVGASPVVCTALDQCHDAGVCNPATGQCPNPPKADGTACTDDDACTRADTCQGGACVGANPVVCAALDQCHAPGLCDRTTGICSTPRRADGTSCSDGDACTESDVCRAGVCAGVDIVCDDDNPCTDDRCEAGDCVPESNDAVCDDADPCTVADQCGEGECVGAFPLGADIVCSSQRLLASPCNGEALPASLLKFIDGKMNGTRKLLQKADAAAAKGKDAKIPKLRTKAMKTLDKISKKVAKAVSAGKPEQRISATCGSEIATLLQQRQQLINAFVF
jgi:hypothetical protein